MNTRDKVAAVFAVLVVVMLAGEVMIYAANPYDYDSDIGYGDDGPYFTVGSSASADFRAVQTTGGSVPAITEVYVYCDTRYGAMNAPSDERPAVNLVKELAVRGTDAELIDADALRELFLSGDGRGKAVAFCYGVLPSTVYTGDPSDPFFSWFGSGGSVYWYGTTIGRYVATDDGNARSIPGYGDLFFGDANMSYMLDDRIGSVQTEFADLFSIRAVDARFGVSADIPGSKEIGYVTDDGFSSASLIPFGKGMLGVVSGVYDNAGRDSFAQIIASGLDPGSELIGVTDVHVRGSDASRPLEDVEGSSVYIYSGGYYTSHGSKHVLDYNSMH